MKKRIEKGLSRVEWEIMDGVWKFPDRVTVREVHGCLYPKGQKAYTTVQTIMNILVEKGYLTKEKIGMVNFYLPTTSQKEMAHKEARSLVSRAFDGSFFALANYLVDSGSLSQKDLNLLKGLIEAKESEGKGKGRS